MILTTLFCLLVAYQLKHLLADYFWQNAYMLGKFAEKAKDWVPPLAAHAGVHALLTFVITVLFVGPLAALGLAALDFAVHFMVDRLKASPKLGGRYKPTQPEFWHVLGLDQTAHHLTHYVIIAIVLSLL